MGVYLDFHGVLKKPGQIVEGIYARKLTGMDQAHEQVPHLCAVLGLIEQGILPVADGEKVNEINREVLSHPGRYKEVYPERKNSKDPSPLKVKEVLLNGKRYIVCLNQSQARKDAQDRHAIIDSLKEKIKAGPKNLIGNKGYRKYLKMER